MPALQVVRIMGMMGLNFRSDCDGMRGSNFQVCSGCATSALAHFLHTTKVRIKPNFKAGISHKVCANRFLALARPGLRDRGVR